MTDSKDKSIIFDRPDNLSSAYLDSKYAKTKRFSFFDMEKISNSLPYDPLLCLNFDINQSNILNKPCLIFESSENIEIHHLRHLKDTKDKNNLSKIMSKINRKTVPLCEICHKNVHTGRYDGLSLKQLQIKMQQ